MNEADFITSLTQGGTSVRGGRKPQPCVLGRYLTELNDEQIAYMEGLRFDQGWGAVRFSRFFAGLARQANRVELRMSTSTFDRHFNGTCFCPTGTPLLCTSADPMFDPST